VSLAVSLHASNNQVRDSIVPLNKKYPIEVLLASCKRYLVNSPKEFVTFEYVMLLGVNDGLHHAKELISLVRGLNCKFNLIPFNPFPNSGFVSSAREHIVKFQRILQQGGLIATIRKTRGENIDAACGQLVGQVVDKTKRQQKWQAIAIEKLNHSNSETE
jgi:23S rRNA (adenine2503-C2)-methyltransferase